MSKFVGRDKELTQLNALMEAPKADLIVIKGRRRIGKSRLIAEFAEPYNFLSFMGLDPREGITAQDQRDEFVRQLNEYFVLPGLKAENWGDLFTLLAQQTQTGRHVISLDEISWMAMDDVTFLSKLKVTWDRYFSKNSELTLIICGSISTWIDKQILSSTGFLGRPSLHITLKELPLNVCNQFWNNFSENISTYEKLKVLAITGGVPRYLELINPALTAEENIRRLCFDSNGPLFDEFNYIFTDIYGKKSQIYRQIVSALVNGKATRDEISKQTNIPVGGDLSDYLDELQLGGFISRDYTWLPNSGKLSKLSKYRLCDNYTRFYLKYIEPNKARIEKNHFENVELNALPAWYSILGLQFENLVVNNHRRILRALNIQPDQIIFDNPFFQRKTARRSGCQIDYMIQTKQDTVYICEIKFNRKPLDKSVIDEVKEKMQRIKLPKYMSRRPVLIHVNGVKDEVIDSDYFTSIIDFSALFTD